jgi:hypothetical protein
MWHGIISRKSMQRKDRTIYDAIEKIVFIWIVDVCENELKNLLQYNLILHVFLLLAITTLADATIVKRKEKWKSACSLSNSPTSLFIRYQQKRLCVTVFLTSTCFRLIKYRVDFFFVLWRPKRKVNTEHACIVMCNIVANFIDYKANTSIRIFHVQQYN